MSQYSSLVGGKVLDWSWVRRPKAKDTLFYIGDKMVGQLFDAGRKRGWSAVHHLPSVTGGPVHGLRSRMAASVYLDQIERMHLAKGPKNLQHFVREAQDAESLAIRTYRQELQKLVDEHDATLIAVPTNPGSGESAWRFSLSRRAQWRGINDAHPLAQTLKKLDRYARVLNITPGVMGDFTPTRTKKPHKK